MMRISTLYVENRHLRVPSKKPLCRMNKNMMQTFTMYGLRRTQSPIVYKETSVPSEQEHDADIHDVWIEKKPFSRIHPAKAFAFEKVSVKMIL